MASYSRHKNSWSVRFRILDDDGNTMQKRLSGFARKMDAERGYREFMANYVPPEIKETHKLTFLQVYALFKKYYKHEIKGSTYITNINRIEQHILPFFGEKEFEKITTKDIADWKIRINNLEKKSNSKTPLYLSFNTKSHIFSALSLIYNYAVNILDFPRNLARKVGDFKKDGVSSSKKVGFWTPEEYKQFTSAYRDDTMDELIYKTLFMTLYLTGCRKGEASALNWTDFNEKANQLNFNKTSTRKTDNGEYAITSPKTPNAVRVTDIPYALTKQLTKLKDAFKSQKNFKEQNFVFGGVRVIPEQSILNWFNKWRTVSGVKKITIHDLRHSHVSLLLNTYGYDLSMLYLIADRIGDTSSEVLKTYGHLFPSNKGKLLETLNAFCD